MEDYPSYCFVLTIVPFEYVLFGLIFLVGLQIALFMSISRPVKFPHEMITIYFVNKKDETDPIKIWLIRILFLIVLSVFLALDFMLKRCPTPEGVTIISQFTQ